MRHDPGAAVSEPSSPTSRLGPAERQAALDAAQVDELDVVVIGGGVVGAGCRAGRRDPRPDRRRSFEAPRLGGRHVAAGPASWSTAACATWRCSTSAWCARRCASAACSLQRLAPHLVRPVPFLYPLKHRGWERPYVGAGVALYDTLGASSGHAAGCRATST